MIERFCPFCHLRLTSGGRHIYTCKSKDGNLSKAEIKLKYLEYNFGKSILEDVCNDYQNLYSLPMIKEKYGLDSKSVYFLLSLKNIRIRSISESALLISKDKAVSTLQKKYGNEITNVSQLPEIKEKVKRTFLQHYGVDNIWKLAEYNKKCCEMYPESHKVHMEKLIAGRNKFWNDITEEQLCEWKEKVSRGYEANNMFSSSLETRFCRILNNLNISYIRQFHIKGSRHPYDFHLVDSKIIIEINGNFWHANPKYYKETDVISYPGGNKVTAKTVWEKDQKFIDYAIKNKYKIIVIWESEMNCKNDKELEDYFVSLLNNITCV